MLWAVVSLWAVSAGITILGLVGLWRTATREAKEFATAEPVEGSNDPDAISYSQIAAIGKILGRTLRARPRAARLDFLLIGGGIALGLLADLLSLAL